MFFFVTSNLLIFRDIRKYSALVQKRQGERVSTNPSREINPGRLRLDLISREAVCDSSRQIQMQRSRFNNLRSYPVHTI